MAARKVGLVLLLVREKEESAKSLGHAPPSSFLFSIAGIVGNRID